MLCAMLRDQGCLPRFGGMASFGNYGGTVQYVLDCQGGRRQCGNCWRRELGADWEKEQPREELEEGSDGGGGASTSAGGSARSSF